MDLILLLAAFLVSFLVFTWLVQVVKSTVSTAITIALILLVVQIFFGVGPLDFWEGIVDFWRGIWRSLSN
ncbi:MAG: hypothetical protein VKK04_02035 [Synechococcales bacterium]|nr:hypothetical protein [Synechococcales bacterium]